MPNFYDLRDLSGIETIEDPSIKITECEYFLGLASIEKDRTRFHWLINAFFDAAYNYFEMSALHAHFAHEAPDTNESIENRKTLVILRNHVVVIQEKNCRPYVNTAGKHPITKRLYELRETNTYPQPLAIMATEPSVIDDFHFESMKGNGSPVLAFCHEAMSIIRQVQSEFEA